MIPASEVIMMKGLGHLPMLEEPRQSAEDYLKFREAWIRQSDRHWEKQNLWGVQGLPPGHDARQRKEMRNQPQRDHAIAGNERK